MNVDPQLFILFSLGIDIFLCLVLVTVWWRHNDELQAPAWAIGQIALTAGTVFWRLGPAFGPRMPAVALMLVVSVAGFWAGTEFFLGKLDQARLRRAIAVTALLGLACYALFAVADDAFVTTTTVALSYAITFIWVGWRLLSHRTGYGVLGWVCVLRGLFNLANALQLVPTSFELWLVASLLVKSASILCLIHAVQDKIQKRYTHAIDSLSKGFLVYDRQGVIRTANERCARLLRAPAVRQLIGSNIADWTTGLTRSEVEDHFQRFAAATAYPYVETRVFRQGAPDELPVELIASPHYERGQLHCMMLVMDITDRKKKDDELYRAAHYDSVTGLLNRHGLTIELDRQLVQARQSGLVCAVLFIDIDKFKRINDSFGHATGDLLLQQLAERLRGCIGEHDLLGRCGGDEFVVVLPGLAPEQASAQAAACGERVLGALGARFDLAQHAITVSASIGVACQDSDGMAADTLVRNADIAMHDVKKSGRGDMRFYDEGMSAYAREALVIDGALRGAIPNGELRLVYQPIVDARTGRMDKVEALLRWHSATLGNVAPDRFIPVAEDSGLIIDLGAWVLAEACRQLGAWREALPQLAVSINVSARQLLEPAFVGLVQRALAEHGLAPQQLELELTERVLIGTGGQVHATLAQLRALGVSISLDDFGTGYSSLSYLTRFEIDTIKIDRSFVTGMVDCPRSQALVATIVALGQSLGLQLVAEGVETADQASSLGATGCHYLQGYHISRPVPADALLRFAGTSLPAAEAGH
ncbi:diguanylate cyclase [Duganella sp. Leaf126]|uniref:putative bifunctional diguanylate cyclase/phosphodiesterase n=1 Tax=Duganella sp. Leaf126 TaxID=1736266 RepID=UPI0006F73229|nr:EAL domain-containing protein [Duganella sp. Leaf126]KQQ32361.1 diguanylate cyclase [Duganella sp. Leaf126]